MKIDSSSISNALTGSNSQNTRTEKSVSTPSKNASTVSLSDAAAKIRAMEQSANQSSGFDAAKVAALKQAISEGKFQITPQMIAEKLLDTARELMQEQTS
ncbi:MAG TPA: flagellar biosynthesis anti-sigma factor FlgM [Methylophilaceae bacterium]|jgi:negative regulator of flagellin synthesis FlgM